MPVENPIIIDARSANADLPPFISRLNGQLTLSSTHYPEGSRVGPYDLIIPFGNSREGLRGLVPESERLRKNTPGITVLGLEQPVVFVAMDLITGIANEPLRSHEDAQDRALYRDNLGVVYRSMAEETVEWTNGEKALVFPPKNGGIFVEEVFRQSGLYADFFDYRMSRVQDNAGGLAVGVNLGNDNPRISDYRTFVFADDCIASDISAHATLMIIQEQLREAGINPSDARILITVSAASQRGLESLTSPAVRKYFGFPELSAVVGTLVYKMDSHFYLRHPDDRFVVGDMGNWTKSPKPTTDTNPR